MGLSRDVGASRGGPEEAGIEAGRDWGIGVVDSNGEGGVGVVESLVGRESKES